ncbi:MAG: hypothetical protein ACRELG_25595, partial [Gemmataceae bacterium]
DYIAIGQPAPGATVSPTFTASGQVSPASSSVKVALNGNSVNATVPGDGTWNATFNNIAGGNYTLQACITGTMTCAAESITVQGVTISMPPPGGQVPQSFSASGQVYPANAGVTVTLNGTPASSVNVNGNNWSANFNSVPVGNPTLQACLTGTQVSKSETITVQ